MAKTSSSFAAGFSRFLKIVIVALLLPLPIGILFGAMEQLQAIRLGAVAAGQWVKWGFLGYVGFHIILFRPAGLFRATHWLFSTLAVWLFGGQVSSTEEAGGPAAEGKRKGKRAAKESGSARSSQGSPLVVFSPYVVPMSVVLVCGLGWLALRFTPESFASHLNAPLAVLLGAGAAFHWLMTADELQPRREEWHVETYLLAVILIFLLTLLIGGACIWWVLPDYSYYHALNDGWSTALSMYRAALRQLFF